jgi:hypothetical protein
MTAAQRRELSLIIPSLEVRIIGFPPEGGIMRVFVFSTVLMWAVAGWPQVSVAAEEVNACGCYRGDDGNCVCTKTKKVKCECAGDCEPIGCEAQRQKQADKEAAAALKRIDEKEKKKAAEAKQAAKKTKRK